MVNFITDCDLKQEIASDILSNLPQWFGLPENTKEYIEKSREMPFWAYFSGDIPTGFIALKQTAPHTAEIYVMGVLEQYHRQGVGTALFYAFEEYAKDKGYRYLQVKTVQRGRYKTYDITNSFYEHMGFEELECLPTLWDEWNPCQIYIKYIGK